MRSTALFLPLTNAALIAFLLPRAIPRYPATALVLVALPPGEFVRVSGINRNCYRVERAGIEDVWKRLEPGVTYYAIGFDPATFLLTGPTLHEFPIAGRNSAADCPAGTTVLRK